MTTKARTAMHARPLGIAIGLALAAVAGTSMAHDVQDKFELTVVKDAAHGAKIAAGETRGAIDKLASGKYRSSEKFFAENNLCVAFTMTARFEEAVAPCEEAVELMRKRRATDDSRIAARYHAMALSNRGVMKALSGNRELARDDFESAQDLRAGLASPARNLEYLERRNARASVEAR